MRDPKADGLTLDSSFQKRCVKYLSLDLSAAGSFHEVDLPADLFDLFFFAPLVFRPLLFEIITPGLIDRYDERTEFFHTAAPDCFGRAEVEPVDRCDLFDT